MYKTKRWLRKRQVILKRDNYICRECKRYGRDTQATIIHHIFPYEFYPKQGLDNNNLLSLCNRCHNKMHIRDSHELSKKGKEWQSRVKSKINF